MLHLKTYLLFALAITISAASPHSAVSPRISGGKVAEPGQFPYVVYFSSPSVPSFTVICSGVLISQEWIITLAASIELGYLKLDDVVAVAGTTTLDASDGVTSSLKTLLMHPDYNPYTEENGLGLVQVANRFTSSNTVKPISIGSVSERDRVTLAGWGLSDINVPFSNQLMYLENPVIGIDECIDRWVEYIAGYYIGDKVFCTYSGLVGEGATEGDGGGAVVANDKLVGLIYLGLAGHFGVPVASFKLELYQEWIENVTATRF